ncbi:MAG TPA: carboxypeptidase-like regulatory domain-containing protein, partial [Thermoanaerobaculia bacterium]
MNQKHRIRSFFAVLSLVLFGHMAHAQGLQTGTITGIVSSQDTAPLPGVTVTASSPALQDTREAVTDVNGVYFLRALPPGAYTVQFTLTGFQSAVRDG